MNPDSQQPVLLPSPAPPPGTVLVNDRVSFQTEGQQRVILVCGMFFSHYSVDDPAAEAYAMVTLFESGYADQNDIARCFGYSTRTLRRYQKRLQAGGLRALARLPGRPPAARAPAPEKIPERDRTILRLKAKERSNRWIAGRLGLSETAIRKALRRLGWNPGPEPSPLPLPFELEASRGEADPITASVTGNPILEVPPSAAPSASPRTPLPTAATAKSIDPNPLDRSMDRLLAAMGLLDAARPMFARAQNLPRAGVLVAIPALLASGLLSSAETIYGNLGPAFYGLRTTLVAYVHYSDEKYSKRTVSFLALSWSDPPAVFPCLWSGACAKRLLAEFFNLS
jgi:transposase